MITLALALLLCPQEEDDWKAYSTLLKRVLGDFKSEKAETEHFSLDSVRGANKEFGPHFEAVFAFVAEGLGTQPKDRIDVEMWFSDRDYDKRAPADTYVHLDAERGMVVLLLSPAWRTNFARGAVAGYLHKLGGIDAPLRHALRAYFGEWDGRMEAAKFNTLTHERHFMLALHAKHQLSKGKLALGKRLWEIKEADIDPVSAWANGYALMNGKGLRDKLRAHLAAVVEGKKPEAFATPALDAEIKTFWSSAQVKVDDREENGGTVGESRHYTIWVETGTAIAGKAPMDQKAVMKDLKEKMDLVYVKYSQAFKFDALLTRRPRIFFHKSEASYVRGGAPRGSLAYYSPGSKKLVAYAAEGGMIETFQTMAHEGCHQFFDLAFPGFYEKEDNPSWFSEGLAECFAACEIRGRDLFIFTLGGGGAQRIPNIKYYLEQGEATPTADLLNLSHPEFMSKADLHYAQSWSLCHFLWNAPAQAGGGGKYKDVVLKLIDGFKRGRDRDEVYKAAFKGMDLDKLHKEWADYTKKLPSPKEK